MTLSELLRNQVKYIQYSSDNIQKSQATEEKMTSSTDLTNRNYKF